MERAAGFHGYRKIPNTSPGLKGMKLPEMNHVNNNNNLNHFSTGDDNECTVREQDRFMPIANVIRIMRKILPPHAKISDDAKETIQECVSEYISFITGEANERCQREQRKTITAEDVLWAMSKLGFDDYIEPLTVYLHRYRELEGERGSMRSDPLMMKRAIEYGTPSPTHQGINAAAFSPHLFQFGHHPHGFFGYLKEASGGGSNHASTSQASPAANGDAHAAPFKCNGN